MSSAIAAAVGGAVVGHALSSKDRKASRGAANASADANRLQAEISKDQWDEYKRIYQPREEQFLNDAFAYDTPERRAQMMQEARDSAGADASMVMGQGLGAASRNFERFGSTMNPNAMGSMLASAGLMGAANKAGMMNNAGRIARDHVEKVGLSMKESALNRGKGLTSNALSGLNSSAQGSAGLANMYNRNAMFSGAAGGQLVSRGLAGFKNWYDGGGGGGGVTGYNYVGAQPDMSGFGW